MVITSIERQKRKPYRVNVYVDGKFAVGLHENVLLKYGLRKGDKLDSDTLTSIETDEEIHSAKEQALRLLSRRAYSEKELRSKLLEKEFHPKAVDRAIELLCKVGLVDDLAFARAYARDFLNRKPSGKILLRQKLRTKGINNETIQQIINELSESNDEQQLALTAAEQILKRYAKSKKKYEQNKKKQWLSANLLRRGFKWSEINSVLKILFKNSTNNNVE